MGIAILVRHGRVKKNEGNYDYLDDAVEKNYVPKLPQIIKKGGLKIDRVYYDNSVKSGKPIERCKKTVKAFPADKLVAIEGCKYGDLFSKENENKTVLICYQSENLSSFPKIENFIIEGKNFTPYTGDIKLHKPDRSFTDLLYRNVVVVEFGDNIFRCIKLIDISDYQ